MNGEASLARCLAAAVVGNALEFYDFLTFAFFATQIGNTFFPVKAPGASLLLSLATFGVGFLTRPLGGFVIGRFGDRAGRRPAMLLSFSLMGFAILGMVLTPSYTAIGLAAPILVITFRLLQGFALGGEVGPTTAYLLEIAPPERRGLYASLQYMTQDFSVLCAGLVGVVLSTLLNAVALDAWGRRVAFLIGAAILPFGLAARAGVPETFSTLERKDAFPVPPPRRIACLGLVLLSSTTVCGYTMTYMTTYAVSTLHMPANVAFGAMAVASLCGICLDPLSGWLSDRIGRRPVMLVSWSLLLFAVFPVFWFIAKLHSPSALFTATAVLGCFIFIGTPPILTAIGESLPRRVRSGWLATIYALAISVFGGTTQFALAWLIGITHNPLIPAWYMIVAVVVGLAGMAALPESAPRVLARRD